MPANPAISSGARNPALPEFARYQQTRRFGSLDGLRAGSCLLVIWHHTIARGLGGVTLFFSLSGFLVTTSLLRSPRRGWAGIASFYGRTARRILPLYFAVLTLYLALVVALEKDAAARKLFCENFPAFATFTANWFVDLNRPRVIFYFVWSLSAQMQFYLLWPWLEHRCRAGAAVVIALLWLCSAQFLAVFLGAGAREALFLRIVSGMPVGILCGVLLAHALQHPAAFAGVWTISARRGSALAALGAVILVATHPHWAGEAHELLAAVAATLLIASCVLREDNDLACLLGARPIAYVGAVSYGIYLFHMLAVNAVRRLETFVHFRSVQVEFVAGSLLAIGLATASHRWFESRFRRPARAGD